MVIVYYMVSDSDRLSIVPSIVIHNLMFNLLNILSNLSSIDLAYHIFAKSIAKSCGCSLNIYGIFANRVVFNLCFGEYKKLLEKLKPSGGQIAGIRG